MRYTYNSSAPAAKGTRGFLTFVDDAQAGAVYTIDNYATPEDAFKNVTTDGKAAVDQLYNDIKNGLLTKAEEKATGAVDYMDIALGDEKKVGLHVHFPQSWLNRYKGKGTGSDKEITWADNPDLATKGVAIYMNKADAKSNDFTQAATHQPYDIILDHKDQTIATPDGSKVTIMKRTADGRFNVQGSIIGYDASGKKQRVDVSQMYSAETGGQNLYVGLQKWLEEINYVNQAYQNHQNVDKRYYDPQHLPKVKAALNEAAGGPPVQQKQDDITAAFLQQVQFNMQKQSQ